MADLELDEPTKNLLKQIVDHFDDEDRAVRDRQIRTCVTGKPYRCGTLHLPSNVVRVLSVSGMWRIK